jgi:hypothetical protein
MTGGKSMKDLIDRQAAIDAVLRAEALVRAYGYRYAADAVRELPSAQPQPVVRCKDCKYWMRENVSDGYCSEMNIGDCDEDFYCGYAVRKDNR